MAAASAAEGADGAAAQPNGAVHRPSSSDQASPRFLEMLRASLPPQDGAAGGDGQPSTTLAELQALSQPQATAQPPAPAPAAAEGKPAKRSGLFGLFRSPKPSALSDATAEASSGSEGKRKSKSSSWFGLGHSKDELPSRRSSLDEGPPALRSSGSGVLLPGLPLTEAPYPRAGSSAGTSSAGEAAANAAAEGSQANLAGVARPAAASPLGPGYAADVSASEASGAAWLVPGGMAQRHCLLVGCGTLAHG